MCDKNEETSDTEKIQEPPAADEVEITVLGHGAGECILIRVPIHVQSGSPNSTHNDGPKSFWICIDSFQVIGDSDEERSKPSIPVAIWYLEQIGVPTDEVRHIVLTHFHKDHYLGLNTLLNKCDKALLSIPLSWDEDTFKSIFLSQTTGKKDVRDAIAAASARLNISGSIETCLRVLQSGSLVHMDGENLIVALSPSSKAVYSSVRRLIESARKREHPSQCESTSLPKGNSCSIALGVRLQGVKTILGADLTSIGQSTWNHIENNSLFRDLRGFRIAKLPHHGSSEAADDNLLAMLSSDEVIALIASFRQHGLPKVDNLKKYPKNTQFFCTDSVEISSLSDISQLASEEKNQRGSIPDKLGIIRIRYTDESNIHIATFGTAKQFFTSS